jgi:hypothetical protein
MDREAVLAIMDREPFVPLRLVKTDGRTLEIPFKHVLLPMKSDAIVFKGIESATSRFAKDGYEHVSYDKIERLEPKSSPGRGGKGGKNGRSGGGRGRRK